MTNNNLFRKYRSRLVAEAILKALLIGASFGFGAAALTALFSWFFGFKAGLYLAIALFVAITGGLACFLYFKKFRPTTKTIAGRVDELGLEERVLTMTELEGDDSYIAARQREDTMKALGSVNHLLLKIAVTASMIVAVVVSGVLFAGSITVDGLYAADVIPSGVSLAKGKPAVPVFTAQYSVARGTEGQVVYYSEDWAEVREFGEAVSVRAGEDAPAVLAVPAEGWYFVGWSDGKTEAYRQDLALGGSVDVKANFSKILLEGYNDEKPEEDRIPVPGETKGEEPEQDPTDYASGDPANQVENGQTYYGDGYGDAMGEAMDGAGSNDGFSSDMKGGIGDYFGALDPGSGSGSGSGGGN